MAPKNAALRLRQTRPVLEFYDQLRGTLVADEPLAREDFIIHRRDGLFAYNLAVVVDDHFQGSAKSSAAPISSSQRYDKFRCINTLAGLYQITYICRWR